MVMHGFKSFANRVELLFGPEFNCVLGPNGSGKSNIMDALCFVLGKAGAKGLRAEKSSNLIYNGGKLKNPAKQGEVSIYFDNTDKTFPTEDNEVKVTRIITQSGQSKYKINDKMRTRQQILDLLSLAKIDPDGYNIILQGDIVRFTEMPSVDRRTLIDDISGISIYEEKKHKAVLELQKVEERLKEADIILTERGTYLKELRKDRDEALKYKEMNDKIRQNKASYIKIQIDKAESQRLGFQKSSDAQKEKIDKINSVITKIKEQNEEKRKELDEINRTIEQSSGKDRADITKEIEDLKVALAKNHTQIEHYKDEINKIKKRRQDLENDLKGVDERVNDLKNRKEDLSKEKNNNLKEREDLANKIKKFKEKNKLDDVDGIEQEIVKIDESLEHLEKKVHELREKQQALIRAKDSIQYQMNTVDEKIKKIAEIEKEHKDQVNELKKQREDFIGTTALLNDTLNNDSSMAKELASLKTELFEGEERLSKLEAKNASIQESILGDVATKKILALKKNGIYGVIADLGQVDSKYSLALEIAAGPRMKSIVVEDDKIAAECINYLKKNKLGTASFLPLNKIRGIKTDEAAKDISKEKGCHGMAIELISFDSKFKKAFDYVFADTYVVDDIETARRIGIGTAKMVTLDGDLAEKSGVMRGGYREKKTGLGFKEADVTRQIESIEEGVNRIRSRINDLDKKRAINEEKIQELREKKANLEGDIIVKEKSLHLEDSDITINKRQGEELKKESVKVDKELEDVISQISEINKEVANGKIKKQELREKIKQLKNPLLLAELNTFEEMKNKLNEEIIRLEAEIKNIEEQTSGIHDTEKEKTSSTLKQIDKEEVEFNNQIKTLGKESESKEKILHEKEKKADEFYNKFKSLFEKKKRIEDDARANDTVIDTKKDESRDIEIKINEFSIKIAEVNAKLAGLNLEFEEYHGVEILINVSEDELKRENIGRVNMRALEIYTDVEKEYNGLLEKKKTLTEEKDDVVNMMTEIESKKKDLFMKTYEVIREKFKRNFSSLMKKGEADLELENEQNIFEGGVNIRVRITGNKFLDIRGLSGGEKTMTALSFIFAIQEHEPASFYILDEVDAALDKHNSERLADLINEYSKKAQYIVISHNDSMISKAAMLYGVSMDEHNVSKVVSLKV
jgi:chromosome segregation protein